MLLLPLLLPILFIVDLANGLRFLSPLASPARHRKCAVHESGDLRCAPPVSNEDGAGDRGDREAGSEAKRQEIIELLPTYRRERVAVLLANQETYVRSLERARGTPSRF